MIRKRINPYLIGALSLIGVLAASPSMAAGENCVMSIDYSMLSDATIDRIYKSIDDANDWPAISKSMKCAQSLTYSKLPDNIVEQLGKGKSPVINMAPTMQLQSPNYAVLSEEEVRSFGGW
jgi:hypothetical protein